MFKRDYNDMVAGAILIAGGLALAYFSASQYRVGTMRQMGPGMFPMGLGYVLAGFGLLLLVQAWFRPGKMPQIRIWSPLFVLLGTAAFAALIRPFGLVPAILGVVIISSLAELRFRPLSIAGLAAFLAVLAWLIFKVGLRLPLQMFKWPF